MKTNKMYEIAKKSKQDYNNIMTFLRNNYYYDKDNWLTIQFVSDKLDVKESQIVEILQELQTIGDTLIEEKDKFKLTYKGVIHLNEIQKSYQNYTISIIALSISFISIILSIGIELSSAFVSKHLIELITKPIIIIIIVVILFKLINLLKN